MFQIKTDDIMVVCGKRRSGKTFFTKWLLSKFPRAVIWDYNHEYKLRNSVIVYDLKQLIPQLLTGKYRYIIYRPLIKTEQTFEAFCHTCEKLRNIVIVIEDVERFATAWLIQPSLKRLIDTGRHKGIGLIFTMRRTLRVNPDITFNADFIFAFSQHRPQDLDYLAEYMNPETVYKLSKLPSFWFICYEDRSGKTYVCRKV